MGSYSEGIGLPTENEGKKSIIGDPLINQNSVTRDQGIPALDLEMHTQFTDAVSAENNAFARFKENASEKKQAQHLRELAESEEMSFIRDSLSGIGENIDSVLREFRLLIQELSSSAQHERPIVKSMLMTRVGAISSALMLHRQEVVLLQSEVQIGLPHDEQIRNKKIDGWKTQVLSLRERYGATLIAMSQLSVPS